jgi:hypothetical protein
LHVRVHRTTRLALAGAITASLAACDGSRPSDLQANVRAAVAPRDERSAPRALPTPAQDERIEDQLASVIAGREGDGLPARMEAVLRRDDEAVRAASAFIRGGRATKIVIDALAAAGTPPAQAVLCDLAREARLPMHIRAEAVASLGLVPRPTAPTMTEIAELIHARDPDLTGPALFLAGSVARAGRADHPTQAATIERLVLVETARGRGTDDLLDGLAALGNLGSASVLPRLRAAATRALRLVPDPEADRLLAATLRRDTDATVRAAAVFAAGFRKLDPLVDALTETSQSDPAEFVRAGAATLLARPRSSSTRVATGDATARR